jgi:acetyl-CoA C-acetyltransferase
MINEMRRKDKTIGLATLCLGGGEAVALIVKRA